MQFLHDTAGVDDVVAFLGSSEGLRAYRFWSQGVLSGLRGAGIVGPKCSKPFRPLI